MIQHPPSSTFRLIGHRGAPALAIENTLESFQFAHDLGLDEVEFDVRMSRDGIPMVIHDASLKRTHGHTMRVAHTPAQELIAQGVPSLAQTLELLLKLRLHATVEIKTCSPGALPKIARMCAAQDLTLSSFDLRWITLAAEHVPEVSLQWTVDRLTAFQPLVVPGLVQHGRAQEVAADIRHLSADGVSRARGLGLKVLAYTIKTPAQLEKAQQLGVDGIFIDDVVAVRDWMNASGFTPTL